ncbi:hypothetical protein N7536_000102 [Penicillium majusculum]|nr:hypothetical protein N7536_000102 [Penicillium majusculum]
MDMDGTNMIPEADLEISARISLTALQIWWLGTPDLKDAIKQHHKLDPGIASLVLACQRLRKNGYRKGRIPLTRNSILNRHVQAMVDDLTEDTLKIFGLLTCHFNEDFGVPLPRQLLRFFDTPWKLLGDVCIDIQLRYATMVKSESIKSFKRKFINLLGLVEYYVVKGKWVLCI